MKTQTMRHHRNDRKLYYPVDFDLLAADLEQRRIDIAKRKTTNTINTNRHPPTLILKTT